MTTGMRYPPSYQIFSDTVAYSAYNMPKFRLALAKMRSSAYRPQILCLGDSITRGVDNVSSPTAGYFLNSYPVFLSSILSGLGIPAQHDSIIGASTVTSMATLTSYDSRVTATGDWVPIKAGGVDYSIGGNPFRATTTGTWTFTPGSNFDTIIVTWVNASSRSATVNAGGSTLATLTGSGSSLTRTTINVGTSASVVNVVWASGNFYLVGVEVYDSSLYKCSVLNAGIASSSTATWIDTTNAWSPLNAVGVFAPDLTIIELGSNDAQNNSPTASQYGTNLTTIATKAKLSGSVIFMVPIPSGSGVTPLSRTAQYNGAMLAAAAGFSPPCAVESIPARQGNNAIGQTNGFYSSDSIHGTAYGYQDMAQSIARMIVNI